LRAELARATFDAGQKSAALREYARALALRREVADSKLVEHLLSAFGTKDQVAAASLISKYKLVDAEDGLEKLTKHRGYYVRLAALGTLEKIGKADRADYLTVWLRDLESEDCDVRRHAVAKLGDLGDKRAIDALRAAKKKSDAEGSWFSSCLGSRTEEAEKKILAKK
jgi:HEAT repeat protein